MLALRCAAQNYDWGREAQDSEVAQLAQANGNTIDVSKPFAELWMGTHPNCPSWLASSGEDLLTFLQQHPELLGRKVHSHFGAGLPFLFKVLSIRKALSIQSHPDKELAQQLHARAPKLYPDPNHKPEMALALSDFEALCGFVPLSQLQEHLRCVPELVQLMGEEPASALLAATEPDMKALRAAFTALSTSSTDAITTAVRSLVARLRQQQQPQQQPSSKQDVPLEDGSACANGVAHCIVHRNGYHHTSVGGSGDAANGTSCCSPNGHSVTAQYACGSQLSPERAALVLRLNEQFPDDVGVLSSLFLNVVRLPAGSAIFLAANEPHAYLSGELVEVMATSDNVIRAGLTPKFRDTQVLCESLTYAQGPPEVLTGTSVMAGMTLYRPPVEEFEIQRLRLPLPERAGACANGAASSGPHAHTLLLPVSEGPRLLLVQSGEAEAQVLTDDGAARELMEAVTELEARCTLRRGSVVLVPAGVAVQLQGSQLEAWAAAVNGVFFQLQEVRQAAAAAAALVAGHQSAVQQVAQPVVQPVPAMVQHVVG